jgi:hypothetical protein
VNNQTLITPTLTLTLTLTCADPSMIDGKETKGIRVNGDLSLIPGRVVEIDDIPLG